MTGAKPHIIKRQVVDVTISEKSMANDIQDRVSEIYNASIIPLLDRLFSDFDHQDVVIRIDTLELDLGQLQLECLEEELSGKLKAHLEEKLTAIVYKARNKIHQPGVEVAPVAGATDGLIVKKGSSLKLFSNTQQKSATDVFSLFEFYLSNGRLPWWTSQHVRIRSLCDDILEKDWSGHFVKKVSTLMHSRQVRRRLIDLFPGGKMEAFLKKTNLPSSGSVLKLKSEMEALLLGLAETSTEKRLFSFLVLDVVFEFFISGSSSESPYSKDIQAFLEVIEKLERARPGLQEPGVIREFISSQQNWNYAFAGKAELLEIFNQKDQDKGTGKTEIKKTRPEILQTRSFYHTDDRDILEVTNAGIVLLWPYLEIFFRELGLLSENEEFVNETSEWRAVHLLQYLSTGEQPADEADLLLNKLICDVPLDVAVPVSVELSEIEKEEAEHLLKVVVKNWPALKNTSIDGLRSSFINRPGILSSDDNGWNLQVEKKPFDILLNKLNWPISVVKLPWNPYLIHVKW